MFTLGYKQSQEAHPTVLQRPRGHGLCVCRTRFSGSVCSGAGGILPLNSALSRALPADPELGAAGVLCKFIHSENRLFGPRPRFCFCFNLSSSEFPSVTFFCLTRTLHVSVLGNAMSSPSQPFRNPSEDTWGSHFPLTLVVALLFVSSDVFVTLMDTLYV